MLVDTNANTRPDLPQKHKVAKKELIFIVRLVPLKQASNDANTSARSSHQKFVMRRYGQVWT